MTLLLILISLPKPPSRQWQTPTTILCSCMNRAHAMLEVEADIAPFRGILLGLFFVNVGFSLVHVAVSDSSASQRLRCTSTL
eukprot:4688890-Amphidinium_carterae.1